MTRLAVCLNNRKSVVHWSDLLVFSRFHEKYLFSTTTVYTIYDVNISEVIIFFNKYTQHGELSQYTIIIIKTSIYVIRTTVGLK